MHIRILNYLSSIYRKLVTSIGFWPALISVGLSLFAIGLLAMDTEKPTTFLLEKAPGLVIKDGDTARVLLSTVVGGILSLTVFSFTMVMSQLNRAANSYSPRLLPGLVSTKRHQVVLGFYLGTICFCLLVLINIEPSDDTYALPGLAVLVGIALALTCLGIFIYFIHSISRAIQVTNILKNVAHETETRMLKLKEKSVRQVNKAPKDVSYDHSILAPSTGYFCECKVESLQRIAKAHEVNISVQTLQGEFILENSTPVKTDKELDDDIQQEILSCLVFEGDQQIDRNYILGFKQITEVAVRAMSPGTNDPGTALTGIDHLGHLLSIRMQFDDRETYSVEDSDTTVILKVVSFADLLYSIHAPLRQYCRHDVIIVIKLLRMLEHLLNQPDQREERTKAIRQEVESLVSDAIESLHSERDREKVRALSERLLDKGAA